MSEFPSEAVSVVHEPLLTPGAPAGAPDAALIARSIDFVLARIDRNLETFSDHFPAPSSIGGAYAPIENLEWTSGFWTGMLWLAYEVTGKASYRDVAERHVANFGERIDRRINVDHHDLGFLYTLSCVSAWKLTGNESACRTALAAADRLLARYLPAAGIIQAWGDLNDPAQRGRMIIDCNLNLPLLYWASLETGDPRHAAAADRHLAQAARHIVRADASTFHTYFMDPESGRPLLGKTHQGYADDSCWARGQAWGISGFPLGYRYHEDAALIGLSKKLANYFLNRLPDDGICYWDLCFTSGNQPRDSSAAAIAACGLLEMIKSLPLLDPERRAYEQAAWRIVRTLSEHYLTDLDGVENGVLRHAVYHMPNGIGVDESCIWGDYFYFESLVRLSRPWRPYW